MMRMYSQSYDLDKISETIKPYCNLIGGELKYPQFYEIYKFRVLVCTLSTSAHLSKSPESMNFRTNRSYIKFKPDHFSYVFIDECASAHETMSLIPIAGNGIFIFKIQLENNFNENIFFFFKLNHTCRFVYINRKSSHQDRTDWRSKATGCSYEIRLVHKTRIQNFMV